MQSIATVWAALDARRRLIVVMATVAIFAAVLFLARSNGSKDFSLLFGGLEPSAAGDIMTALDQRSVPYEVRGNGIFVDPSQRDTLRMALAGEGLPTNGAQGYELLDSLSGFGTTSQMFDAAYWRAKEGELARTILTSPQIRAARVHISTPVGRPFQRDQSATAAVTVQSTGGGLSGSHVKALQYLVASAVSGLSPDNVAVIDADGGLLSANDSANVAQGGDERADALRLQAERLLAARVGPGNAVVEVAVDTVTETESITERQINPDSRVAISTDTQESTEKSQDNANGDVTVASNLPAGDGAQGGGSSNNENSETRSLTNYEVSETQREILRAPGAVRRLTIAVLVNDVKVTAADGTVTNTPRTAEELADLEQLVASAVGLDTDRGDVLTLRSMPFEPVTALGTEATLPVGNSPLDMMRLIQVGVLAVVALILGLFVVRPILRPARTVSLPPPTGAQDTQPLAISASSDTDFSPRTLVEGSKADADPVARLRSMIAERESETIQILQDWIEDPVEKEQI